MSSITPQSSVLSILTFIASHCYTGTQNYSGRSAAPSSAPPETKGMESSDSQGPSGHIAPTSPSSPFFSRPQRLRQMRNSPSTTTPPPTQREAFAINTPAVEVPAPSGASPATVEKEQTAWKQRMKRYEGFPLCNDEAVLFFLLTRFSSPFPEFWPGCYLKSFH